MEASKNNQPIISIYLDGSMEFQLKQKAFSGTMAMKIDMHERENPVTLVLDGYHEKSNCFGIPTALCKCLLDLFDVETNSKIPISPSDEAAGSLFVPAASTSRWFNLSLDPLDPYWDGLLSPGRKYEIRWSANAGQSWCYYGEPEESFENITRLPVCRMTRPLKLTVYDNTSTPPRFSISLSPTASVCHLSGNPRFAFELEVISHEEETITVCLDKTPFRELHGLGEVVNAVDEGTGKEVEWPIRFGCFEGMASFPSDEEFEELAPEIPYRSTFYLDPYDPETSEGDELGALEVDRSYKVGLNPRLPGAFTKWIKGTKVDLLSGTVKEKKMRWNGGSGCIAFERTGPFTFETSL